MLAPLIAALLTIGTLLLVGSFIAPTTRLPIGRAAPRARTFLDDLGHDLADAGMPDVSPIRFLVFQLIVGAVTWTGVEALGVMVGAPFAALFWFSFVPISIVPIVAGASAMVAFRYVVLGPRLERRRAYVTRQVGEAAAELAEQILGGRAPEKALQLYAARARTDSAITRVMNETNVVAAMFRAALARKDQQGLTDDVALRWAADAMANHHFTALVETYLQLIGRNNEQLATAMQRLADEVDFALRLEDERRTLISRPVGSYKMVGLIIVGLLLYGGVMLPASLRFLGSTLGQVSLVVGAAYWYLGARLQIRSLSNRL